LFKIVPPAALAAAAATDVRPGQQKYPWHVETPLPGYHCHGGQAFS